MLVDNSLESITIEHGKHFTLIGYLHSRGVIVAVTGNNILASTHGGNHELLAQFT